MSFFVIFTLKTILGFLFKCYKIKQVCDSTAFFVAFLTINELFIKFSLQSQVTQKQVDQSSILLKGDPIMILEKIHTYTYYDAVCCKT